jgi:hypothetical protein
LISTSRTEIAALATAMSSPMRVAYERSREPLIGIDAEPYVRSCLSHPANALRVDRLTGQFELDGPSIRVGARRSCHSFELIGTASKRSE